MVLRKDVLLVAVIFNIYYIPIQQTTNTMRLHLQLGNVLQYEEPYINAATAGNIDALKNINQLIQTSGQRDAEEYRKKRNSTALIHACINGHLNVVQYLLKECKAEVEGLDGHGMTPLLNACRSGHWNIAMYLTSNASLTVTANVNAQCHYRYTVLHHAMNTGTLEHVKYLTQQCQLNDVDTPNCDGSTSLHFACRNNNFEFVKYLTQVCHANAQAIEGNNQWTVLHEACRIGNLITVQYLVQECHVNINPNDRNGDTPLTYATRSGHQHVVQYLLSQGAKEYHQCNEEEEITVFAMDDNKDNSATIALHEAITTLHDACRTGNLETVQHITKKFYTSIDATDCDGYTAVIYASRHGQWDIVYYLTRDCHANVNIRTNDGWTALHYAIQQGQIEMVQHLTKTCYANIEIKDKNKYTTLLFASRSGHYECVPYLITECYANIEAKDDNGRTVLHHAVEHNNLKIIKFLVQECNCNINTKDYHGNTPINDAYVSGYLDIVQYLQCQCNVKNVETMNKDGKTVLQLTTQSDELDKDLPVVQPNCYLIFVKYIKRLFCIKNDETTKPAVAEQYNTDAPIETTDKQGITDLQHASKNGGNTEAEHDLSNYCEYAVNLAQ